MTIRTGLTRAAMAWATAMLFIIESPAQDLESIGDQKPVTVSGSIGVSTTFYDQTGIGGSRRPFTWVVSGGITPMIYGVDFPVSFTISAEERSFRQPFNQFGMSPGYGPVRVHAGYRSMTFSPYTLSGVTFLGGGLEAAAGRLRLAAMSGRLQRAVEEDTTNPENQAAYDRHGWGAMIGYADEAGNSFDLSLLKARDDTSSLRKRPVVEEVLPMENTVLGGSFRVVIAPGLSVDGAVGASLVTRDITSGPMDVDTSSIPEFLLKLHDLRSTTSLAIASRAGMTVTFKSIGLRAGYERIEPGYTSLGAYYFATDLETWTIAPSVELMESRLRLSGSVGLQRDNLMGIKVSRTDRVIGSATINWNASEAFSIDGQFTNYSTGQSAGRMAGNDSILARDVTRSASLSPRLVLQNETASHSFMLTAGYQSYTDLSAFTGGLSNTDARNMAIHYGFTGIESHLSLNSSLSYNDASSGDRRGRTVGASIGGALPLLNESLSLAVNVGYARTGIGLDDLGGNVFSEGLTAGYRPTEYDAIHLIINGTQSNGFAPTTETSATFGYTRGF